MTHLPFPVNGDANIQGQKPNFHCNLHEEQIIVLTVSCENAFLVSLSCSTVQYANSKFDLKAELSNAELDLMPKSPKDLPSHNHKPLLII